MQGDSNVKCDGVRKRQIVSGDNGMETERNLIMVATATTTANRLSELRDWRNRMKETLGQRIAELTTERREMMEQYDEEIGQLEAELGTLGVHVDSSLPNDTAVKAYNYLAENAPSRFRSGEIMKAIGRVGALACVILRPMIERGRVKTEGEGRSTRYYVESTPGAMEQ